MPSTHATTIAAIATPPGPGPRGVIRISGPATRSLLAATTTLPGPPLTSRAARAGTFHDGRGDQPLLLLWMPGPRSYTREDVAELHLPGAPPLLRAALERLLDLGAVLAAPGEFTRRAFESGRIDLARAEGVLALVQASNDHERRAATALLLGGLGARVAELRARLEEVRALAEASLDFDEDDAGHVPAERLLEMGRAALETLDDALAWEERREPLAGTPRIALAGAPNAGKSSLFNALTGGRALVSDVPGTTRDGVAGLWRLEGVDCRLLDAPGLEPGATEADRLAQELARAERAGVDLLVWVVDARRAPASGEAATPDLEAERAALPPGIPVVLAWSQTDRLPGFRPPQPSSALERTQVVLSAHTGAGLGRLARACASALGLAEHAPAAAPPDALGRELSLRHRQALESARRDLQVALDLLATPGAPLDLVAEALRAATDSLDAIEGRTSPEDLLDRIFARFCLGK